MLPGWSMIAFLQQNRPLDDIPQFAHIARPMVGVPGSSPRPAKSLECGPCSGGCALARNDLPGEEYLPDDPARAAAQSGSRSAGEIDPAGKLPLCTALGKIAIGGGDHPQIDLMSCNAAQPAKRLLLQNAQELGLNPRRQVADFIQEQGSAVGYFEQALLLAAGIGVGSRLASE